MSGAPSVTWCRERALLPAHLDDEPQETDGVGREFTLLSLGEQAVLKKSLEDLSDVLDMFLRVPREDKDVVDIKKH